MEYLGVLARPEVVTDIFTDVLMILCVLGVAMLMLLALFRSDASPRKPAAAALVLASAAPARAQTGAMLHPWEYPCAGGETRAPPLVPPMQARMTPLATLPAGALAPAARVRIDARC